MIEACTLVAICVHAENRISIYSNTQCLCTTYFFLWTYLIKVSTKLALKPALNAWFVYMVHRQTTYQKRVLINLFYIFSGM